MQRSGSGREWVTEVSGQVGGKVRRFRRRGWSSAKAGGVLGETSGQLAWTFEPAVQPLLRSVS
jgi:hypothetical protein